MNSDYSMFYNRSTLGSSLSGLAQSIQGIRTQQQQSKLAEIALRQEELKAQQAQEEQKKRADYEKRVSQYMGLRQINPQMTLEEDQELQNRMFAPELLQRRLQDPFEAQRVAQRDKELGIRATGQQLSAEEAQARQKRFEEQQERLIKQTAFDNKYKAKRQEMQLKNYDRGILEADRQYGLALSKLGYEQGEEARKDAELLQEIAPELQKWKKPDQDLNPINVNAINKGTAAVGNIISLSDKLKSEIKTFGLQKLKGEKKAEMEARVISLAASLNDPMFVDAGVLNEKDMENLKSMIGDPTDFMTLSEAQANAKMKSLEDFIESKYVNALEAYGIRGREGYTEILNKSKGFFKNSPRNIELNEDDKKLVE